MKMPRRALALALVPMFAAGCTQVQAKQAFKDGNKAYKEEDFKKAIAEYGEAVQHNPGFAEAWFYLGSSHNALYRPGKDSPENVANETLSLLGRAERVGEGEGTPAVEGTDPSEGHS